MGNRLFLLFLFLGVTFQVTAQELNFTVTINSERARTQNKDIFDQMKNSFEQFLNGRSWTNDQYDASERIKGNILVTINDMPQVGYFEATVQIQAVRPVYGTSYETLSFNFVDRNWNFEFKESQPMEFNRYSYLNEITSLLAYYAHIVIGLDYDTFSQEGGEPYFEIANNIVSNALQSGRSGWDQDPGNRRNRYWLIDELYSSQVTRAIREASYLYHRKGLDQLTSNPEDAYKNILQALEKLAEVNNTQPNSILTITFMDAKSDEISKILQNAPLDIQEQAVEHLLQVDPNNARKYNDIL
ncbi:DUF4835 domain-containing protein [Echinicola strongylocentroti]|uniref:DUF4835 domain-containing protein n=1 Tax=Echinicola strongylocentroti TaxID=1795355 RepID=A0A2Z4IM92_9BACT|nr:DUF4835 family protein [Echinicola strongylocentroti]AWW31503.1 DUF4835 domain-containing protein [Echinicola strongylocentroti]